MLIQNTEPKTYIILGMHRSGTSLISKALSDQGADMGDMVMSVYEDKDFLSLNTSMLTEAGGSWNNIPTDFNLTIIGRERAGEIKKLVDKKKSKMWGWKDPRTCFTLPAYLPHLDGDVYLFCCFRKPDKVAHSIHQRDKTGFDKARRLVDEYNKKLISHIKNFVGL